MIIDTHVHLGKIMDFDMKKEDILYSMEKYGIDYSIVSDIRGAEFDHKLKPIHEKERVSQIECAKSVIEFAKENPNKIGAAIWVKPFSETADSELYELIKQNRDYIKAIKLHPYHSTVPFDSPKTEPYIELAEHFGLPIVTHTGGSDAASCIRVYNSAKRHHSVQFVMVHMGLGTDNLEAIDMISRLPNLYGDTTWVPIKSAVRFISTCGANKLIFGSDNPIDGRDTYFQNSKGERSLYQEYFNEFRNIISKTDYEKVMYRNAQKLFNI